MCLTLDSHHTNAPLGQKIDLNQTQQLLAFYTETKAEQEQTTCDALFSRPSHAFRRHHMNTTFIANFVGKASPSTIKKLAAVTHENGGKWLISKVNFIEDQVAAVIKVEMPTENVAAVQQAFKEQPYLTVEIVESSAHTHNAETIFQIRLDANDRAGIVNEITHLLDDQGIDILDMDCQRVFIAGGGGVSSSFFTSQIALRLPRNVLIADIAKELESLSEDTRVVIQQ